MKIWTFVLVLALAAGLAGAYGRTGWTRMEAACSEMSRGTIDYAWTWQPLGFTCTFEDGTSQTELWF